MLISSLNYMILAAFISLAHAAPLSGISSVFAVFWLNRKHGDDAKPTLRSKLYFWLAMPSIIMLIIYFSIPVLVKLEMGILATSSVKNMAYFFTSFAAGIIIAIVMLRTGVQALATTKNKLTKNSELERNRLTDIRNISAFLPNDHNRFDPLSYIDFKKGIFFGLDEADKPLYASKGDWETSHVSLCGRTRSGKGVSTQILGVQSIMLGEFFVSLDPKIDTFMPHIFKKICDQLGKPYHFLDLRQSSPPQINIFDGCDAGTIENMMIGGFGLTEKGTDADYYRIGDRKAARDMARWMAENPGKTVRDVLENFAEQWKDSAAGFCSALEEMAELPAVNRVDEGGIDIESMAKTGGCLYVIGDMQNTRIVRMQRLILMRLMLLAKERDVISQKPRIIRILADEFRVHASKPFIIGLAASAGWRLLSILAFQSFGDLKDCPADLDPEMVTAAVTENCAISLAYRIKDPRTAEIMAAATGEILVDVETRRVEKNLALSETIHNDRSISQSKRYLIDENMIKSLPVPNTDKKTIGCGVLLGVSSLARFCFTSPVMVTPTHAAITPTARPSKYAGVTNSVGSASIDVSEAPELSDAQMLAEAHEPHYAAAPVAAQPAAPTARDSELL